MLICLVNSFEICRHTGKIYTYCTADTNCCHDDTECWYEMKRLVKRIMNEHNQYLVLKYLSKPKMMILVQRSVDGLQLYCNYHYKMSGWHIVLLLTKCPDGILFLCLIDGMKCSYAKQKCIVLMLLWKYENDFWYLCYQYIRMLYRTKAYQMSE